MSKIKKSELLDMVREQGSVITNLLQRVTLLEKPQLKQLDQSVFNGLDEKWRFAAVDSNGDAVKYTLRVEPHTKVGEFVLGDNSVRNNLVKNFSHQLIGTGYDASNWQNSLIERDKVELTGSELCRAMLARGDTRIMCIVSGEGTRQDITHVIRAYGDGKFHTKANRWTYAVPINNQGEPLTAAEVGL